MNLEIGSTPAHAIGPDLSISSVGLHPSEHASHSASVLQTSGM